VSASPVPQVSVDLAALVSMYTALEVSMYIADARFLDAASTAVAAEAAAVGAAELAGYGHPRGAGSTPAGPNLHVRVSLSHWKTPLAWVRPALALVIRLGWPLCFI
jgi:hypothetical protein